MDADSEEPIILFQAVCQVLNHFDVGTAAGKRGAIEEMKDNEGLAEADQAKHTFFWIPQFLFLVAKMSQQALTGCYLECVTTNGATD